MNIDKAHINREVYNAWINDKRTVKQRLKDVKKLLKKMLKNAEKSY